MRIKYIYSISMNYAIYYLYKYNIKLRYKVAVIFL